MRWSPIALALLGISAATSVGFAAAIKASTVGCNTPADAQKIAVLQFKRDQKGADALSQPLIARRACIELSRGAKIEVEEKRVPMACVRLTGDLSCFWIDAGFVNEHPDEKRESGSNRSGGQRGRGHGSSVSGVDGLSR